MRPTARFLLSVSIRLLPTAMPCKVVAGYYSPNYGTYGAPMSSFLSSSLLTQQVANSALRATAKDEPAKSSRNDARSKPATKHSEAPHASADDAVGDDDIEAREDEAEEAADRAEEAAEAGDDVQDFEPLQAKSSRPHRRKQSALRSGAR